MMNPGDESSRGATPVYRRLAASTSASTADEPHKAARILILLHGNGCVRCSLPNPPFAAAFRIGALLRSLFVRLTVSLFSCRDSL